MYPKLSIRQAVVISATLATAFLALPVHAQLPAIVPDCARNQGANAPAPSLNCALQTFGNIAQLILGVTGSFALLMFVYGGFVMVTSAGNSEKVEEGKTILRNAVLGILIILGSGTLLRYGLNQLQPTIPVVGQGCGGGNFYVQCPDGSIQCSSACPTTPTTTP